MKRVGAICAALLLSACSHSGAGTPDAGAGDVQVLSLSTFLGQLDPLSMDDDAGVQHQYGGLGALSAYFKADRAANPNTILLLGSDSWGASPPLSAQFGDLPTVLGLEYLGASADMLSNHNFDHGIPYLQNLVDAGSYPYVATNMAGVQQAVGAKVVVPYQMLEAGSVKIAFLVKAHRPERREQDPPGRLRLDLGHRAGRGRQRRRLSGEGGRGAGRHRRDRPRDDGDRHRRCSHRAAHRPRDRARRGRRGPRVQPDESLLLTGRERPRHRAHVEGAELRADAASRGERGPQERERHDRGARRFGRHAGSGGPRLSSPPTAPASPRPSTLRSRPRARRTRSTGRSGSRRPRSGTWSRTRSSPSMPPAARRSRS